MSDDGTKSIFLFVSLVNLYPVCKKYLLIKIIKKNFFSKKIFGQEYFQSHWNNDILSLGKTNDEQIIIKKCLQVRRYFLIEFAEVSF